MSSIPEKDDQKQGDEQEKQIPIIYNKCATFSGSAKFDASKCPHGGSVPVQGDCVEGGWIFCGTHRDPDYPSFAALLHGDALQVYGGTFALVSTDTECDQQGQQNEWYGQKSTGTFTLTHDGNSPEILVIYGTKEIR